MEPWITSHPDRLGGKPCIRGTRISVEFLLELLANGATPQEILESYPHIPADGLAAALRYAAQALRNEIRWEVELTA